MIDCLGMKKLLQYLLFTALFLFCAGYAFQSKLWPSSVSPVSSECTPGEDVDTIKQKFEAIAHADYEDYLQLKSESEKAKKADEILGKIMAIFMADLGIHLKEKQVAQAASPAATPASSMAPALHQTPTPIPAKLALVNEAELRDLRTDSQDDAFIKKETLSDPKQSLFSAVQIRNPHLQ